MTIKFRSYQKRMIAAQDQFMADLSTTRATILAATGSGKTEVFIDLIKKLFDSKSCARVLIAHPRIALSQDQQSRLRETFRQYAVEFTSFHSGHQSEHTLPDRKNISTTSKVDLEQIRTEATTHHITFSSYKSLSKIARLDFDIIICDEAHYLVQSDLRNCLKLFKSNVLFYTGTPIRAAAREESMDNVELFGNVIAEVPPSELIPFGYIVPPRIRSINVKNSKRGNTYDYAMIIAEAFRDQKSLVDPAFNHKMLVAMPRTKEFDRIMQDLAKIRQTVGDFNLDLYFVTASRAVKNGVTMQSREVALKDFQDNTNPAIIIHCDTLAEGIDVDGLGGVLVMRGLGMVKAIQTMGRGCRAAKADIKANGEIRKNRVKTECIVTLARVDNEWCGDVDINEWARMFREAGYGNLWDFFNSNGAERGPGAEIGEHDDPVSDIIEEIRFHDGIDSLWGVMFVEVA